MSEEKKFNEERLSALEGKSKKEILADKELTSIYIDSIESLLSN